MNKISAVLYRLALLPSSVYERLGINTAQLSLILRYKLIMDDRYPNSFQQARSASRKKNISNATYGTMIMAFLMGLIYIVFFITGRDLLTHLTFFFSAYLFMLASMLISDFTSVLIDVRDNQIILPAPVNDRTVVTAKLLHIMVHLSRLVIPMCLPSLVMVFIQYGTWDGIAFLLLIVLASVLSIFLINSLYLLVLKFTTPSKFKSFIAWFQIGFAVLLYLSYQLVPRIADMEVFQQFSITEVPYAVLLPSYWFAGAQLFLTGIDMLHTWYWFLLTVGTTVFSTILVIRWLAPAFNSKLSLISGSGGDADSGQVAVISRRRKGIGDWYASIFTTAPLEKAAFLFSWKWTARSREFKLRVYPTMGYVAVWMGLTIFRKIGNVAMDDPSVQNLSAFIALLYFSAFVLINAIFQVNYSEQYRAAWIFFSAPVEKPGPIITGSYKSMLCKFYLPAAIILAVFGMAWYGPGVIPNLLLGLSNELVICSLLVTLGKKKLPASLPSANKVRSGAFLRGFFILLISGTVAGIHFLLHRFTAVVLLLFVLSVIANWLLLNRLRETKWEEIKVE